MSVRPSTLSPLTGVPADTARRPPTAPLTTAGARPVWGSAPPSRPLVDRTRARRDATVRRVVVASLIAAIGLVTWWWATGGGLSGLRGWVSGLDSVGRWIGLVSAVLLLFQVLAMARIPLVETAFGQKRLARGHRLIGFTSFTLMVAHIQDRCGHPIAPQPPDDVQNLHHRQRPVDDQGGVANRQAAVQTGQPVGDQVDVVGLVQHLAQQRAELPVVLDQQQTRLRLTRRPGRRHSVLRSLDRGRPATGHPAAP